MKADITTVRLLFVHLMQKVRQNPSEDNLKKLLLLPTVLFCTNPKPQYPRENLRHKACLILADDWSLFTVNAFPGRTKNTNCKADRANFYKFVSPGPSAPKNEAQEFAIRRRAANKCMQAGEVGKACLGDPRFEGEERIQRHNHP